MYNLIDEQPLRLFIAIPISYAIPIGCCCRKQRSWNKTHWQRPGTTWPTRDNPADWLRRRGREQRHLLCCTNLHRKLHAWQQLRTGDLPGHAQPDRRPEVSLILACGRVELHFQADFLYVPELVLIVSSGSQQRPTTQSRSTKSR